MEDAATAEISRSQVWQWVVSPKGVLDDGRKVTVEMVRPMIAEELAKVKATVTAQGEDTATYDQAAGDLRQDVADPGLPGVPDPAAVRSDGLKTTTVEGDKAPGDTRRFFCETEATAAVPYLFS